MTQARQRLGRRAEELVARRLAREGWRVLARNARVPGIRGELDLVAHDGRELVFVEVKAGAAGARAGPVSPLEMVGPRKRAQLRRLASAWARAQRSSLPPHRGLRIDVVALRLDSRGDVAGWWHVRAAC